MIANDPIAEEELAELLPGLVRVLESVRFTASTRSPLSGPISLLDHVRRPRSVSVAAVLDTAAVRDEHGGRRGGARLRRRIRCRLGDRSRARRTRSGTVVSIPSQKPATPSRGRIPIDLERQLLDRRGDAVTSSPSDTSSSLARSSVIATSPARA